MGHVCSMELSSSKVQALCCSLQDSSILVQRCALDLLLLSLPIHNNQLVASDMVCIVTSAVTVVLRRDMSLNRRLFSWLLGTDLLNTTESLCNKSGKSGTDEKETCSYFKKYSKELLLEAVRCCLKCSGPVSQFGNYLSSSSTWCYRLLVSLLDRPEISSLLLDDVLIDVFRSLYFKCLGKETIPPVPQSKVLSLCSNELIKTANLLFATLEPSYLWTYLGKSFKDSCENISCRQTSFITKAKESIFIQPVGSGQPVTKEMCNLLDFVLDIVPLEMDLQARVRHLPELFCCVVEAISLHCVMLTTEDLLLSLDVCSKILAKMQAPAIRVDHAEEKSGISCLARCNCEIMSGSFTAMSEEKNGRKHDFSNHCFVKDKLCNPTEISKHALGFHLSSNFLPDVTDCLKKFKILLTIFLREKFLENSDETLSRFDAFLLNCERSHFSREEKLVKMLNASLEIRGGGISGGTCCLAKSVTNRVNEKLHNLCSHLYDEKIPYCETLNGAFTKICQLILELSNFQTVLPSENLESLDSVSGDVNLPVWLKLIICIACFADTDEAVFAAAKTVFDLIAVTLSASECSVDCISSLNKLHGSCHLRPVITPSELEFLYQETFVFEATTAKLWEYIGSPYSHICIQGAQLMQHVHNLSAADSPCEAVISSFLTVNDEEEQLSALKKFSTLWHLTRDMSMNSSSSVMFKAFDQCFFLILDCLEKKCGSQKIVAETWLNHSLQRNDVYRFFEPLLLILLHPDSSRVSVQHVNIHCPTKVDFSDKGNDQNAGCIEEKIYAISSVCGNVIYHISDESLPTCVNLSPQRKILAISSVCHPESHQNSEIITHDSMFSDFELPSSHERGLKLPISVFVNPFGSLSSLCSDSPSANILDVSHATRIEMPGKSSFDDDDEYSDLKDRASCSTLDPEKVVSLILEDILRNITGCSQENFPNADVLQSDTIVRENQPTSSLYISGLTNNGVDEREEPSSLCKNSISEATAHPLHAHILLYCQVYDSERVLYTLSLLKAVLNTSPRLVLCSIATTNLSSSPSYRGQKLQSLLVRHRRSVFGNDFHGELGFEGTNMYRSSTFLETVILTCVYYIRSYYPNLPEIKLTYQEIVGNVEIKFLCLDILSTVFSELSSIVKDCGRNFASYLNDLLLRCKVQKTFLHCLNASVHDVMTSYTEKEMTFTEAIVRFNERHMNSEKTAFSKGGDLQTTFQVHLLKLMTTLVILEEAVIVKASGEDYNSVSVKSSDCSSDHSVHQESSSVNSAKYQPGLHITSQAMLLRAVLSALCCQHMCHIHLHWLSFVTSVLPFAGYSLPRLVTSVAMQLCCNLELVSSYIEETNWTSCTAFPENRRCFPPDYLITIIECLTTICHYCLLEFPTSTNINPSILPPVPSQTYSPGPSASQIISNLFHVFSASSSAKDSSAGREHLVSSRDPILSARRAVLSNLPRIMSSLLLVHQMISSRDGTSRNEVWLIVGAPKTVKQHILSFLSPISLNYSTNFIAAIAVVWHELRKKEPYTRRVTPSWSREQLHLVDLISSIKVLPVESVVQTVRNILKQPPAISEMNKAPVEVSALQFFLAYIQKTSGGQLMESWQSLLHLLRDGLQFTSPAGQFLLLAILHEFVQQAPGLEDRKSRKDLQDIAHKLIDACVVVAGASLEQNAWLWRNLSVRPGTQSETSVAEEVNEEGKTSGTAPNTVVEMESSNAQYSVQALTVLAEFLAPVLDFIYLGEEKEKVVPLLSNIMCYVTPYLKNHSSHNVISFTACSQLLASISGYQHTRKAWRKDALELLLDQQFFKMPLCCSSYWKAIVDHLMTHDKTTFRDFMARLSVAQSGSLNLFGSKDQENEQKAHLFKRLAFILFCSEVDQYEKFMPDIQERLTESLKSPHVPSVSAEIFLCFRVLLLRMSAQHVTSLWPLIFTEMVQVFMQMEYELSPSGEDFSSHLQSFTSLDSSYVMNNKPNSQKDPALLHLYFTVCKLLDMAVALPANFLPQFQMYQWAFINDNSSVTNQKDDTTTESQEFTPYTARLARLMSKQHGETRSRKHYIPGKLMLKGQHITELHQLYPFFCSLSSISYSGNIEFSEPSAVQIQSTSEISQSNSSFRTLVAVTEIESVLDNDFIEMQD